MATANDTAPRGVVVAFTGRRVRPLDESQLPAHWPRAERARYLRMTAGGLTPHAEAFNHCEAMATLQRGDDESERDYFIRHMRALSEAQWRAIAERVGVELEPGLIAMLHRLNADAATVEHACEGIAKLQRREG